MSSEIVKQEAVAIQQHQEFFTQSQEKMIRDSFLNGATREEATVLMELARVRRLNPITGQIHFVARNTKTGKKWSSQVGIDGFRVIAERTGRYDGQDEPEFERGANGMPTVCRVRVYRKDWSRPAVGVAHFSEYAQTSFDGKLTQMWASKPHIMLAKCAEALALRKAFPDDLSGLYTPDEMAQADNEVAPKATRKQATERTVDGVSTVVLPEPPAEAQMSVNGGEPVQAGVVVTVAPAETKAIPQEIDDAIWWDSRDGLIKKGTRLSELPDETLKKILPALERAANSGGQDWTKYAALVAKAKLLLSEAQ